MLITLEYIKQGLNIDEIDVTNDNLLNSLILECGKRIVDYCNQPIEVTALTKNYSGMGGFWLVLNEFPVNSITTLKYRDNPIEDFETIDADDYKLVELDKIYKIYYTKGFFPGEANYEVAYSVGYTAMPYPIQQVCRNMVIDMYNKMKNNYIGYKQINRTLDKIDANITLDNLWQTEWTEMLNPYRKPCCV